MQSKSSLILASTALALIMTPPLLIMAKNAAHRPAALLAATSVPPLATTPAAPLAATPADSASTRADSASTRAEATAATRGNEPPATAEPTTPAPAAAAAQTAEPAVAPDPLASLDPADRAVAEKIRELLAEKADKLFGSTNERASVEAFYQSRNLSPLWLDKGVPNARAAAVIARMGNAAADGLEPGDYKAPAFAGLAPVALAEAELKLTHAVLTYARHVQAGRFPYSRVSRNIELPQAAPEPADVLRTVADAADAGTALDAYSPQNEPYHKLKAMLGELRAKFGDTKGEAPRQIETIIANMERWRWYPRDLGEAHSLVNLPDFTLKVMHNGQQVWTTRIVIGKPSMPTPLLSERMKTITVNPTWHVPQSIVHNEYLPALAQDPTVLERMGLRVSYSGGGVEISMPPGDSNALGRVRFNFPNRFSVYQHDTPNKDLFAHTVRAYSHGCMRVQDPPKYAEVLLNLARPNEHWSAGAIRHMYGRAEQDLQLQPVPILVHLTYQTAFIDNAGKLQFRPDVYNLDSRTLAAIKRERGNLERARRDEQVARAAPRKLARQVRTGALFRPAPATLGDRALALQPVYR
jgi:murein L,D-transpeptidase YcbB/YkuD